ncbi:MAG: hypothetical protein E6J84_07300 [Deltaproteobacteria bacterium]|nr:MAG: hypothetical protein E6J84_07300 [Deltaproteobacteria bacterium]
MEDTREHKKTDGLLEGEARRRFMRAVLADLRALEQMLEAGAFERGVVRIGAEQELFLVDRAYHPAPGALKILERIDDPHFTTELGLFNLEANADPQPLVGKGLSKMEEQLALLFDKVRRTAAELDMHAVLAGILPTIGKSDLGMHRSDLPTTTIWPSSSWRRCWRQGPTRPCCSAGGSGRRRASPSSNRPATSARPGTICGIRSPASPSAAAG